MTLVADDIATNPNDYDILEPDRNIDFRRVKNLKVFFRNHAISLTLDVNDIEEWLGGDIVIFKQHIGIVSDRRNKNGIPYVIHHNDPMQKSYEEDVLEKLREENKEYLEEFNLVWDNRDKLVAPYEYAVPWIDSLKKQGLKVYLLSNYPKNMFTLHTECGAFPFIDHVDGKVVSGFVKMVKPNADIYEHLLKEYDLKAEECVFLDDRQENVEGAKALGIKGIVVKSYEQASAELKELLGK